MRAVCAWLVALVTAAAACAPTPTPVPTVAPTPSASAAPSATPGPSPTPGPTPPAMGLLRLTVTPAPMVRRIQLVLYGRVETADGVVAAYLGPVRLRTLQFGPGRYRFVGWTVMGPGLGPGTWPTPGPGQGRDRCDRAFAIVAGQTTTMTVTTSLDHPCVILPTFPVWRFEGGVPVGCDAVGVPDPVYGRLDGDPGHPTDPVWLTTPGGERLSIVWPEGFVARFAPRFAPEVSLHDETGALVAAAGDDVQLGVSRASADGSPDDPFYASGILIAGPDLDPARPAQTLTYHGCYPRKDPAYSPTP